MKAVSTVVVALVLIKLIYSQDVPPFLEDILENIEDLQPTPQPQPELSKLS